MTNNTGIRRRPDKEIVTPDSVLRVCITLTGAGMEGLVSICVTEGVIPSELCVFVPVYVCACAFLAFYLGIASEQFTTCHSISKTGSKSERERRVRRTMQQEKERKRRD